ncbi:MAG: cellulase family glycosylhydrolase [Actinomycetota bacterium]|nr:cellulase family glycosylhydrolase [Actinomycetota bacterium]
MAGVEPAELETLARLAGASARRFPLDWRQVESVQDTWNEGGWDYYRVAYDAILDQRMTPVISFGFAPPWARLPGAPQACRDFFACRYPPAPEMDDEWREFAAEVARRFPRAVLEVWNEPNLAIFWRPAPDPERFAELQAIAFDAIKSVRPSTIVLAGGLAAIQEADSLVAPVTPGDVALSEFLDRAYSADPGIKGKMDAISFHPYPYGEALGAGSVFAKSFQDVRVVASEHGDAGRALWVTETGIPTAGNYLPVTEEVQADVLVRMYRRLATMEDVDGIFLHRLLPPPTEPAGSIEVGYALLRSATPPYEDPKPGFCALVELAGNKHEGCP